MSASVYVFNKSVCRIAQVSGSTVLLPVSRSWESSHAIRRTPNNLDSMSPHRIPNRETLVPLIACGRNRYAQGWFGWFDHKKKTERRDIIDGRICGQHLCGFQSRIADYSFVFARITLTAIGFLSLLPLQVLGVGCDTPPGVSLDGYATCEGYSYAGNAWNNNGAYAYRSRNAMEGELEYLAEHEPSYPGWTLGQFNVVYTAQQTLTGGLELGETKRAFLYNALGAKTNQRTQYTSYTYLCEPGYTVAYYTIVNLSGGDAATHPAGCSTITCTAGQIYNYSSGKCETPDKEQGAASCPKEVGNPVNLGVGNKYHSETDAQLNNGIVFERFYNSRGTDADAGLGYGWTSTYHARLSPSSSQLLLVFPDGRKEAFQASSGNWIGDADAQVSINNIEGGYEATFRDGRVATFDEGGWLKSWIHLDGRTETISYEKFHPIRIDTSTGEYLIFGYDANNRIAVLTDNVGRTWNYRYDVAGNLEYVDNPDGTSKRYHYENSGVPHALTGITDERGIRYATWSYDSLGRANLSTHAGDAQRVDIVYDTNGTRTVTNSRNQSSTYNTVAQLGVSLVTDILGPGCSTCSTGNTSYNYDPANNILLSKTTDGVTTKHGNYDTKGQYGCKVEGVTAADTSTGECTFDPVASPDARRTDYTYDPRFHNRVTTMTKPSVYTP